MLKESSGIGWPADGPRITAPVGHAERPARLAVRIIQIPRDVGGLPISQAAAELGALPVADGVVHAAAYRQSAWACRFRHDLGASRAAGGNKEHESFESCLHSPALRNNNGVAWLQNQIERAVALQSFLVMHGNLLVRSGFVAQYVN